MEEEVGGVSDMWDEVWTETVGILCPLWFNVATGMDFWILSEYRYAIKISNMWRTGMEQ